MKKWSNKKMNKTEHEALIREKGLRYLEELLETIMQEVVVATMIVEKRLNRLKDYPHFPGIDRFEECMAAIYNAAYDFLEAMHDELAAKSEAN
jgi:hypothetical protein